MRSVRCIPDKVDMPLLHEQGYRDSWSDTELREQALQEARNGVAAIWGCSRGAVSGGGGGSSPTTAFSATAGGLLLQDTK